MRLPKIPGLGSARRIAIRAFLAGLAIPPVVTVNAWAEQERVVSAESGSPYPGKWDSNLTPYTPEIQDCVSFGDPCRDVAVKKSAQVGVSEVGINLFGTVVDTNPSTVLIVLPTTDEAKKYNKIKLQPTIDATPALRRCVQDIKSRDEDSSTALFKKFRGGFAVITGANSSTGLQMVSARVIIFEEVSEYPDDAGGRGDPVEQALSRSKAFLDAPAGRNPKRLYISTPGIKGTCRITAKYEAGDQRVFYVPCPHCGHYQPLVWERLKWNSEAKPHGAYYVCAANGCLIDAAHRRSIVSQGAWLKTYAGDESNPPPPASIAPEDLAKWRARSSGGRDPSFFIWQAYSPFVSWDDTVAEFLTARGNPRKLKVFYNQALGQEWQEKGEAPAHEKLFERRELYRAGVIPPGGLFLTIGVDVQGNRLEYYTYAWGIGLTSWLIDRGVIAGDPNQEPVWQELQEKVVRRQYEDIRGGLWRADAIGIDSGYLSGRVYAFCRRHALDPATRTHRVFAVDGRPGWKKLPLGQPSKVDVDYAGKRHGTTLVWPVGTWDLKSELYAALQMTIEGPNPETGIWPVGAAHFNETSDREFFQQLTAEYLKRTPKANGLEEQQWVKTGPNEAHDCAIYARALAHHLTDQMGPQAWAALAARRAAEPEQAQKDLAALWSPPRPAGAENVSETAEAPPEVTPAPKEGAEKPWIGTDSETYWN